MSSDKSYRVGIDIGGTFTDLVLIDDGTGEQAIGKVLTTPGDPSEAVEEGLRGLKASMRPNSRRSSTARRW